MAWRRAQGRFDRKQREKQKIARSTDCYKMKRTWCMMRTNIFFWISRALRGSVILEEALPIGRTLFSPFGPDTLGSFAGLLWELQREEGIDGEDKKVNLTLLSSWYVLGGVGFSLDRMTKKDVPSES